MSVEPGPIGSSPGAKWADRAQRELDRAGHRAGGARAAVVDLLAGEDCCLTAHEIADGLVARRGSVGLASVYRALDVLGGLGLVHRIDTGDGPSRFERATPGGEHHHHAVCERCGEVTPFEDERLEEAIERLGRRLDHRVSAHEVVIRGACPRCARAMPAR